MVLILLVLINDTTLSSMTIIDAIPVGITILITYGIYIVTIYIYAYYIINDIYILLLKYYC